MIPIGLASLIALMVFLNPDLQSEAYSTLQGLTHTTDSQTLSQQSSNNSPVTSQPMLEQSPYGPKQTQYYIQEFRSSSLYPNLLDCSDSQLVHLLVLFHNMYPNDQLTVTGNQYGSYLEDFNLGIAQSADLQNLFETYHC